MALKRSFPPVCDQSTRLLILGSLPGEASLAQQQYYANPRNGFWSLMERVLDQPLTALAYPERLQALLRRGVGLWDVVGSADREGSLDGSIRNASSNDLASLVRTLPMLVAVGFNGSAASRMGRAQLGDHPSLKLIDLPSSSPARAVPLDVKAATWITLGEFVPPNVTAA